MIGNMQFAGNERTSSVLPIEILEERAFSLE